MGRSRARLLAVPLLLAISAAGGCDGGRGRRVEGYAEPIYERDDEQAAAEGSRLGGPWKPSQSAAKPADDYATPDLPTELGRITEADLVAHLNKLVYDRSAENGQLGLFPCVLPKTNPPVTCPDQDYVTVFIQPEVGMKHRSFDSIKQSTNGVIVARLVVYDRKGQGVMQNLGIDRGHHAWWAVRNVNGTLHSIIIGRASTHGPGAAAYDSLNTVALDFRDCSTVPGHQAPDSTSPTAARWWNCAKSTLRSRGAAKASAFDRWAGFRLAIFGPPAQDASTQMMMTDVAMDGSGWIRCGVGCCSTQ